MDWDQRSMFHDVTTLRGWYQGTASFINFAYSFITDKDWHTRLNRLQTDGQIGWLD